MTALQDNRNTDARIGQNPFNGPVAASAKLYLGALIVLSAGYLAPGSSATGLLAIGRSVRQVDNSAGGNGALRADVDTGRVFLWANGDGITAADIGNSAFILDDQTVTKGNSGQSPAGIIAGVDAGGVWVEMSLAISRMLTAASAGTLAQDAFQVDELTNPLAASTTGLLDAGATTVADQTILAAAMKAPGLAELAARPRNITVTGGGTTAHAATSADVVGTDIDDNALLETIALTAGSGTGVKAFKTVVSATFKGATNTDATEALGYGTKFGLSRTIKSRAGRLAVVQEIAAGAVVTNGTFVDGTTSPPHGTYAPNTAPDGANDYSVTYEHS